MKKLSQIDILKEAANYNLAKLRNSGKISESVRETIAKNIKYAKTEKKVYSILTAIAEMWDFILDDESSV